MEKEKLLRMIVDYEIEYQLGERVFFNVSDGDQGVVIDIQHTYRYGIVSYLVVFGRLETDSVWCDPLELSRTKIY